jgi:YHS domain-containing protein
MIEDPVCVTPITFEDVTYVCHYHGHLYYCCSMVCKQRFDQAPEAYFVPESLPLHIDQQS